VASKRFTRAEVASILRQYHSGEKVPLLCRRHGVSEQTFYLWLARWRRPGAAAPSAGRPRRHRPRYSISSDL